MRTGTATEGACDMNARVILTNRLLLDPAMPVVNRSVPSD